MGTPCRVLGGQDRVDTGEVTCTLRKALHTRAYHRLSGTSPLDGLQLGVTHKPHSLLQKGSDLLTTPRAQSPVATTALANWKTGQVSPLLSADLTKVTCRVG